MLRICCEDVITWAYSGDGGGGGGGGSVGNSWVHVKFSRFSVCWFV